MDAEKLVFMANQIAGFFKSYPDADAIIGIDDHIRAFWTPKMRATFATRIHDNRTGVHALVLAAMDHPHPRQGESPIKKIEQGPEALGELVSDAG
jgi:formate dehydrogenase subunit delta